MAGSRGDAMVQIISNQLAGVCVLISLVPIVYGSIAVPRVARIHNMRAGVAIGIGITAGQDDFALLSRTAKVVTVRGGMVWASGAPGSYRRRWLRIESPFACSIRISDGASCVDESVGSVGRGGLRTVGILHCRDDDGRSGRRIDGVGAPVAALFTRGRRSGSARLWVHGGI